MADEITFLQSLSVTNGNFTKRLDPGSLSIDQSAQGAFDATLDIGTSEEVITFTDITSEGLLYLHNLDSTNYVTYGPTSAGAMVTVGRLKAGEYACFRAEPGLTFRMQANTATCKVHVVCLEA